MDISKIMITKTASSSTQNAEYSIEYRIEDLKLQRVSVSIFKKNNERQHIGYISLENDMINYSVNANESPSIYLAEFEEILSKIKTDVEAE